MVATNIMQRHKPNQNFHYKTKNIVCCTGIIPDSVKYQQEKAKNSRAQILEQCNWPLWWRKMTSRLPSRETFMLYEQKNDVEHSLYAFMAAVVDETQSESNAKGPEKRERHRQYFKASSAWKMHENNRPIISLQEYSDVTIGIWTT